MLPLPDVPPGLAGMAAIPVGKPQEVRVANPGACPPVHPNEVKANATGHEVVLTFVTKYGAGTRDDPMAVVECARLVLTWPMLETLVRTGVTLLEQAGDVRVEVLWEQLAKLGASPEQLEQLLSRVGDGT